MKPWSSLLKIIIAKAAYKDKVVDIDESTSGSSWVGDMTCISSLLLTLAGICIWLVIKHVQFFHQGWFGGMMLCLFNIIFIRMARKLERSSPAYYFPGGGSRSQTSPKQISKAMLRSHAIAFCSQWIRSPLKLSVSRCAIWFSPKGEFSWFPIILKILRYYCCQHGQHKAIPVPI